MASEFICNIVGCPLFPSCSCIKIRPRAKQLTNNSQFHYQRRYVTILDMDILGGDDDMASKLVSTNTLMWFIYLSIFIFYFFVGVSGGI